MWREFANLVQGGCTRHILSFSSSGFVRRTPDNVHDVAFVARSKVWRRNLHYAFLTNGVNLRSQAHL